jgi:hypothetical protein
MIFLRRVILSQDSGFVEPALHIVRDQKKRARFVDVSDAVALVERYPYFGLTVKLEHRVPPKFW